MKENCPEVLGDVRVWCRDDGVFEVMVHDENHRRNGKWGEFMEGIMNVARRVGASGTPVEVYYGEANGGNGRRAKAVDKKAYTLVYSSNSNGNGTDPSASKGDMSKEQSTSNLSEKEREELAKRLQVVLDGLQKREGEPTTQGRVLEVFLAHVGRVVSRDDFLSILAQVSDDPDRLLLNKVSQLRPKFQEQDIEVEHVPAYRVVLKAKPKSKKASK